MLLVNARLLDPGLGLRIERGWLLIEGRAIRAIGEGEPSSPAAHAMDCAGGTVMPGLIDCCFARPYDYDDAIPAVPSAGLLSKLKQALSAGFTTVRMDHPSAWAVREAADRGVVQAPWILAAGGVVEVPLSALRADGNAGGRMGCGCFAHRPSREGETEDEVHVRSLVADRIGNGADHIVLDMRRRISVQGQVTPGWLVSSLAARAVSEAMDFGKLAVARVSSNAGLAVALQAGVRSILVSGRVDRDGAQEAARLGSVLVPVRQEADVRDRHDVLAACVGVGAVVAFASGSTRDGAVDLVSQLLARAELQAPADIITSATTNAARALRREGRIGTLRPGADADLLILAGNPLSDLTLLGRGTPEIRVLKRGRLVA